MNTFHYYYSPLGLRFFSMANSRGGKVELLRVLAVRVWDGALDSYVVH